MQKLCGRVAELLREHPILWLPYLSADLLAIGIWWLRGVTETGIIHWFRTSHSALAGGAAFPRDNYEVLNKALFAVAPIAVASVIAIVWLFVAAILATDAMVGSVGREQRPNFREMLADLAARWWRALLFALRLLLTFAVFAVGTVALSFYLLYLLHRRDLFTAHWLSTGLMLLSAGPVAWLVMPAAMRLIGGGAAVHASARTRNQGTILVILAVGIGIALGFILPKMEPWRLFNSQWEITAVSVFNSFVVNAPFAVFFVALAVLAGGLSLEGDGERGSRIRDFLRLLIPLHFGKSEEPPEVEG
jgi:hypothetical protein